MPKIQILLADDHGLLRATLQVLLNRQPDMEVVGEASSIREVLQLMEQLAPDVLCLDRNLADGNSIANLGRISQKSPGGRILVMTGFPNSNDLAAALSAGAHGYISKTGDDQGLLSAIRAVHSNRLFVDLDLGGNPAPAFRVAPSSPPPLPSCNVLSHREREVLLLLAGGHTNQQIADQLFLSVKTIETYRARLIEKLGMRDRADLYRYALEAGLIKSSPQDSN